MDWKFTLLSSKVYVSGGVVDSLSFYSHAVTMRICWPNTTSLNQSAIIVDLQVQICSISTVENSDTS